MHIAQKQTSIKDINKKQPQTVQKFETVQYTILLHSQNFANLQKWVLYSSRLSVGAQTTAQGTLTLAQKHQRWHKVMKKMVVGKWGSRYFTPKRR